MTAEKVNTQTQELASLPEPLAAMTEIRDLYNALCERLLKTINDLEPAMLRLLAWLAADPGTDRRKASISQLRPSGLWLVELSTAVQPYCPGRSASFVEAIEIAIAASDESREDGHAELRKGDKRPRLGD
jgi:hypothetical protein